MERIIEANAVSLTNREKEVAGQYPTIIVTGTPDKPLFHIVYVSAATGSVHVGFSSYELAFVFQWLEEYFGVTRASTDNLDELRPRSRWRLNEDGKWACSECDGLAVEHPEEPDKWQAVTKCCPNCGARMEDRDG